MPYLRNLTIKMGHRSDKWYWELRGRGGAVDKGNDEKFMVAAKAALRAWKIAAGIPVR